MSFTSSRLTRQSPASTPSLLSILFCLLAFTTTTLTAQAYRVNIRDTDAVREVCTGMYGGKEAYIERESSIFLRTKKDA